MTRGALVLAGGGPVGLAWELGFLRGIEEGTPDLMDLISDPGTTYVGTSAGSIVAARLASGRSLDELLRPEFESAATATASAAGSPFRMAGMVASMIRARIGVTSPEDGRKRLGAYALRTRTISESAWVDIIAQRVPDGTWPDRRLLLNAVDVDSGVHRVLDRESGVDLVRAVAASCAVPGVYPPVTIEGRRYMDGGMRSIANADMATGCDPVLVLAPLRGGGGLGSIGAAELRALAPARVRVEYADRAATRAFGRNPLSNSTRAASAEAGQRQGQRLAPALRAFWSR